MLFCVEIVEVVEDVESVEVVRFGGQSRHSRNHLLSLVLR
jgi:hypothetical protein